jgi:hypothetical protein
VSGVSARLEPAWPADFAAFSAEAAGRSFAHDGRFREAFAAHGPRWQPRLLVARAGPGAPPSAAWLGYVQRRYGGAWIRSMPFGTPAGPLFARSLGAEQRRAAAEALWAALDALAREEGWLGGDVTLSGPAAATTALQPAFGGTLHAADAHVVSLADGYETWRASLAKRARQQFRKAERLGVKVTAGDAAGDLETVHAQHVEQMRRWTGGRGVRPVAFYRALLVPPTSWRLWVARAEGAIVCGVLGHVDPDETYLWWSGSSLESRRLLAFPYVLDQIARECGSRAVNLGFSGGQSRLTSFKEQLGAVPRPTPVFELAPRPRTAYHRLLARVRDAARGRARRGTEAAEGAERGGRAEAR